MTSKIIVTGAAGFVGFSLCKALLDQGLEVVGIDNMNDYYDPSLKQDRLAQISASDGFSFYEMDVADPKIFGLFREHSPEYVVHLAAQAGVRYSLQNPHKYIHSNLVGFANILEAVRATPQLRHFIYASSSSVYGDTSTPPYRETEKIDRPVSLYAATKAANEVMGYSYAHLYGIPSTALRFFTVYGPWGRPDMAYFSFTKKLFADQELELFNEGRGQRDFTFVGDIVNGIISLLACPPEPVPGQAPHEIFNIGNSSPVELEEFVSILEDLTGKKARKKYLPQQLGDVVMTCADTSKLEKRVGFKPTTPLRQGLKLFVEWYRDYFSVA